MQQGGATISALTRGLDVPARRGNESLNDAAHPPLAGNSVRFWSCRPSLVIIKMF